ncbi:MAG TPA: hypothetical protein VLE74_01780 [Candidatus Saccharimonadales bacterium]|nr:hypothetical protein [Candidatus Saccharimonadales bacterium]
MEWNRGPAQTQPANQPVNHVAAAAHTGKVKRSFLNLRLISVGLLFCITVLLVALVAYIAFGGPAAQGKYVDKTKMQAVFLNGGQVYFGKITNINDKFMRVGDIYYLRVNQQVQPDGSTSNANQDVSLVKLGCELHGPQDSMVISQQQVIFWENLKDDGQVAKAVAQFKKDNPKGQTCNTTPSTSGSNSTTPAATTPATTTPSTSTTKKP